MSICPICRTKLIPIVYGLVNPELVTAMARNLLILSMDKNRKYNSFCPLCEESYEAITDMPILQTMSETPEEN